MKTFHILTFGCQMNYADAARIKTVLLNCDFKYEETQEKADIIILVTCSIKQKAEDKITWLLQELLPHQKIWISGCMIQHNLRNNKLSSKKVPTTMRVGNFIWTINTENYEIIWSTTQEIKENLKNNNQETTIIPINHAFNPQFFNFKKTFENVELFWRIDDTWYLPKILEKIWYNINYSQDLINEYDKIIPTDANTSMNTKHKKTAYIPISTWCNQFCSYCIVPFARWLERNFDIQNIIKECKVHLENGAEELVLLGQIVNKHPNFVELLKEVLLLDWLKRLRYTSPYPTYYSQELLELHENEEKLCPHIHMPLQSWSDKVLKEMNRWYDSAKAKEFIDKIRNLKREISITTDIIVWFPNESEQDFQDTIDLVNYGKFDMIYIWIYSPRPWTQAYKSIPDNVPYETKHERRDQLNKLLKETSLENNTQEIWWDRTVLIDNFATKDINGNYKYQWHTDNMKKISIKSNKDHQNWEFIKVKITKWQTFKLYWDEI